VPLQPGRKRAGEGRLGVDALYGEVLEGGGGEERTGEDEEWKERARHGVE
jgi:hypothetical protein